MAAQNICNFNKFGFCKFSENCRKNHINEKCSKSSCDISTCQLRHPKVCRYLRDYKYCKFGEWCKFLHVEAENNCNDIIQIKKEQENLAQKLNLVEKQLEEKNDIIESILKKFDFDILEGKITAKDNLIKELDQKINQMEEKMSVLETKLKEATSTPISAKNFKCNKCDFNTHSEQGLKTHEKRKHTEKTKPLSSKETSFECTDCDFIGKSKDTLEVHNGKMHTEKFKCGLCEILFDDIHKLETHLTTCEIYRCTRCLTKEKTITGIQAHVENHTDNSYLYIHHLKTSREDKNEVSQNRFYISFN